MARVSRSDGQIVKINLRDKEFVSFSKAKLMAFENTRLANTFSGAHDVKKDKDNRVYLDNNPEGF